MLTLEGPQLSKILPARLRAYPSEVIMEGTMRDPEQVNMVAQPSSSGDDSHDEDDQSLALQLLHRGTSVLISGNQRTKQSLVGLKGVVKKAVGLGGWHWLRLSSGEEVRLQRNALTVLEPPTGQESVRLQLHFNGCCCFTVIFIRPLRCSYDLQDFSEEEENAANQQGTKDTSLSCLERAAV